MVQAGGSDAYRALAEIGSRLHESHGAIDDAFSLVVSSASELLATEVSWLSLTDDTGSVLRPEVLRAFRDPGFTDVAIPVTAGLGGRALRERRTVVVENYSSYTDPDNPDRVWDALHAEGLQSVMCSPMILRDKLVGALYVATRQQTAFRPSDIALLEALASQATVAIENRRLYRRLDGRNHRLEQSLTVHRSLTRASADGVGVGGIAAILGDLTGLSLVVEPTVPGVDAVAVGGRSTAPPTSYPIRASSEVVGSLTVYGLGTPTSSRLQAIEHGVTVLALELVKLRAQWDVEERMSADLLGEMLDHDIEDDVDSSLRRRAARFGVDISEDFRVIVIGALGQGDHDIAIHTASGLARAGISGVLYSVRAGDMVIALPRSRAELLDRLLSVVTTVLRSEGYEVVGGVGPLAVPRDSFAAATACCSLARRAGYRPGGEVAVVHYDVLGPLRFLLDATDVAQTERMVLARLGPLIEHDSERTVELLPTLRAFVMADGHYERSAASLFIGTTTLKYRLAKIVERFDIDPKDPDTRFELRLAFELLALIRTRGVSGQLGAAGP